MYKFIFHVFFLIFSFSSGANVIKYPIRAENLRIGGEVQVLYDVNKDGVVENIRFTSSDPPYIFDRSVRKQISYWKFATGEPRKDEQLKILFKSN